MKVKTFEEIMDGVPIPAHQGRLGFLDKAYRHTHSKLYEDVSLEIETGDEGANAPTVEDIPLGAPVAFIEHYRRLNRLQ